MQTQSLLETSGQALRVPGGCSSQISRQSAHEGGKVVSLTQRPPLSPRKYSWYSFLLETESNPRAIVRPEGLCQWKIPMTPSGIEPTTFRLVSQCLNQLRHCVSLIRWCRFTYITHVHNQKPVLMKEELHQLCDYITNIITTDTFSNLKCHSCARH